jgi:hypothetical protein
MYIWALLVLPISVWEGGWSSYSISAVFSLLPCIFERCLCCLYPVSGRSGGSGYIVSCCILPLTMYIWALLVLSTSIWEGWLVEQLQYSLLYSPFNNVYLSVACAAYQCLGGMVVAAILCCILPLTMYIWAYQCLGGVVGAAILCFILPLAMYIWALLVLPISVWEEWLEQLFSSVFSL